MTLFASPDIAALVIAFPPPSPTKDQLSLVRSISGNNLYNSQTILTRFRSLLGTEPSRIKHSDLPSRLGIKKTDWLFDCYEGSIHFSRDKQSIIPEIEYGQILRNIQDRSRTKFLELSSIAGEADILPQSLYGPNSPLRSMGIGLLPNFNSVFLINHDLAKDTKQEMAQTIAAAASEKVDLTQLVPDVPKPVLRELAHDTCAGGELEDDDDRIVFVPTRYESALEEKRRATYESRLQDLMQTLHTHGSCQVTDEVEASDVCSRYRETHTEHETAAILSAGLKLRVVVLQPILSQILDQLKSDVVALASSSGRSAEHSINANIKASLIAASPKPELASLLLQSKHLKAVEDALGFEVARQDNLDGQRFQDMFQLRVMAPAHLYAMGVVADATLKQRLDEYLSDYFRNDVIPRFVNTAREQGLLQNDKTRAREIERLQQVCSQAKTLSDIKTAVSKFSKKQKIDGPSIDQIKQMKQQTLQQKVKAMQKMSRGSDVLQNLTWILLAQRSEGLFMSSGKDTSRMVKQYQTVDDDETSRRLQEWRDALKAGKESDEDLQNMKEIARSVVNEMYGQHDDAGS